VWLGETENEYENEYENEPRIFVDNADKTRNLKFSFFLKKGETRRGFFF